MLHREKKERVKEYTAISGRGVRLEQNKATAKSVDLYQYTTSRM
jgi:predicted secreted protein